CIIGLYTFLWMAHAQLFHAPNSVLTPLLGVVSLILTKIPIAVENYCEMGCAYDFCTKPLSTLWARSIGPLRLAIASLGCMSLQQSYAHPAKCRSEERRVGKESRQTQALVQW